MKERSPQKSEQRRAARAQMYAAASSMGYNVLGATVWAQPGVAPKVAAVGLALKGAGDYRKAYGYEPILGKNRRERARQRFNEFTEVWAQNDGISLKDRMKRNLGREAQDFKDREYSTRFNRMMGGMAFGMAGVEIMATATNNTQRIAGAAMAVGGVTEQLHNMQKGYDRSYELDHTRPIPEMHPDDPIVSQVN